MDQVGRSCFISIYPILVFSPKQATFPIEIINNTRGGIQSKIWERANVGQIQVPDVLNNENCTVHPNSELSVPHFPSIRDLHFPTISALPYTTNVFNNNAPSGVIYNLYGLSSIIKTIECLKKWSYDNVKTFGATAFFQLDAVDSLSFCVNILKLGLLTCQSYMTGYDGSHPSQARGKIIV